MGACDYKCQFCRRPGSHRTDACGLKEQMKWKFIENKIHKHGMAARLIARDLITDRGLPNISEAEFANLLKQKKVSRQDNSDYESYMTNKREA